MNTGGMDFHDSQIDSLSVDRCKNTIIHDRHSVILRTDQIIEIIPKRDKIQTSALKVSSAFLGTVDSLIH